MMSAGRNTFFAIWLHYQLFLAGAVRDWAGGTRIATRVPFPGSLWISMRPPWRSTMPYTTDRPRPVPFSLVVKNGMNRFFIAAAGMPQPQRRRSRS